MPPNPANEIVHLGGTRQLLTVAPAPRQPASEHVFQSRGTRDTERLSLCAGSHEEIAGILRTTPNLQSLRMEFYAGGRLMAFSDALKHARSGGVPLLEHLHFTSFYEFGHRGMDWQVRWARLPAVRVRCQLRRCARSFSESHGLPPARSRDVRRRLLVWPSSFQSSRPWTL